MKFGFLKSMKFSSLPQKIFFLAVILLFLLKACHASGGTIKYISIGLRIGHIDGKGYTFGGKISCGVNFDTNFSGVSRFANITAGFNVPIFRKQEHSYEEYNFLQFQYGDALVQENIVHICGGAGVMFYHDKNKIIFKPIASFYCGCLLYVGCDYIFLNKKSINVDFGLLASLPIMVHGFKFGLQ